MQLLKPVLLFLFSKNHKLQNVLLEVQRVAWNKLGWLEVLCEVLEKSYYRTRIAFTHHFEVLQHAKILVPEMTACSPKLYNGLNIQRDWWLLSLKKVLLFWYLWLLVTEISNLRFTTRIMQTPVCVFFENLNFKICWRLNKYGMKWSGRHNESVTI